MTDTLVAPAAAPATDEARHLAPLYAMPRLALASGRGARVRDTAGAEYLDFVSGIAVNAFGHCPSGLASAVARQLRTLGQVSNLFTHAPGIALADALAEATGYDQVFFCNSGTEAVDAALKFCRARAAHRGLAGRDILAFRGGFHGRTGFALSATWTPKYRAPFEPLIPGVRFADLNRVEQLDQALDSGVCAVIVEPVQGEAGVVPATRAFLTALRARTQALGAALVFDEVQCGMGRCGRLLAAEQFGVAADLTVLSKALGGGYPLAAVLMRADTAQALAPGMHGCTFGGSPPAAVAGAWVLARVRRPSFLARVRRNGRRLLDGLHAIVARHPALSEARGLGLLTAVEVAASAPFDAAALVAACREQGLLVVRGGERAVRLLPPLTVTEAEIHEALERLEAALARLATTGGVA
ncbi:MAG TPA: aspartate aminotransferase family protein [Candidatus Eisenbacteria bacterium]|nr:aspartate aminotransferase family protein [Candidatus Eisenbacteria bacterium]